MIARQSICIFASLTLSVLLLLGPKAHAEQPTGFTFIPTFQDPDPGKRHWEKTASGYVEILPSGRRNTFKVYREGFVNGLKGTMLRKVGEPNFYVFVADSKAKRLELWWWRDKEPWKFMGLMKEVTVPAYM
jgi:hypothetical protein